MRAFTPPTDEMSTYVVEKGETHRTTKILRIRGKKRALKRLGLPADLPLAHPEQSKWGQEVSVEAARKILGERTAESPE